MNVQNISFEYSEPRTLWDQAVVSVIVRCPLLRGYVLLSLNGSLYYYRPDVYKLLPPAFDRGQSLYEGGVYLREILRYLEGMEKG